MMKLHDAADIPFEATIDARFPYNNPTESSALIEEASNISLNAVFCVLDEICRPPIIGEVTKKRQRELLAEWSSTFVHDLKGPLVRCANGLIDDEALPCSDAIAIIEQIGGYEAQRAALSVAYFAADSDSGESGVALEAATRRVTEIWEQNGV